MKTKVHLVQILYIYVYECNISIVKLKRISVVVSRDIVEPENIYILLFPHI